MSVNFYGSLCFRDLFGFSKGDMEYDSLLYSRQGLSTKNKSKKVRYELKRKFAKLMKEQLSDLLKGSEVIEATRRSQPKPRVTPPTEGHYRLELDPALALESFSTVALVSWSNEFNGSVVGRVMDFEGQDAVKDANSALKCLFDVW